MMVVWHSEWLGCASKGGISRQNTVNWATAADRGQNRVSSRFAQEAHQQTADGCQQNFDQKQRSVKGASARERVESK